MNGRTDTGIQRIAMVTSSARGHVARRGANQCRSAGRLQGQDASWIGVGRLEPDAVPMDLRLRVPRNSGSVRCVAPTICNSKGPVA